VTPAGGGPSRPSRLSLWLPVVALATLIFVLSSFPYLPTPPGPYSDKWEHMAMYGLFSTLIVRALAGGRWPGVRAGVFWSAVVLSTLYGISDEVHQSFVPGRAADGADVVADAIGAAIAAGLLLAWAIIRRRRQAPESA
jgi:VanZ family protein